MEAATHQERSKLVQRQKQERQELEKKVKKLKGAMKEAAQKELEELEKKHEAELTEFDAGKGVGGSEASTKAAKSEEAAKGSSSDAAADAADFRERHWSSLSKKELEEECALRGIGKKGSKEELITKLTIFHQELATKASTKQATDGAEAPSAPKAEDDDDEDGDDEDDSEDEDDDDENDAPVDEEEMEKQFKREQAVQKAVKHLLKVKCPEGFPASEFVEKLASVNVSNFAPEKLGYKTIEKFLKSQPEKVLRYDKKQQMVLPPR
mmetsp:Transcript_34703/g.81021  ORF Transcript_34703/g.81021 Transcript_34703/m.81021 type:complete len:266 (-) Transcript_34703:155-952(-)